MPDKPISGLQEVLETMTDEQQDELDLMQRNPRIYQDLARSIAPQVRELQVLALMLWNGGCALLTGQNLA